MAVTIDTVHIYINNFTKVKKVVRNTTLLKMLFKKIENLKRLMNGNNPKHWSLFA